MDMNYNTQYYRDSIKLNLLPGEYSNMKAKRYQINHSKYYLWIPNRYLEEDGTIKNMNIDFILRKNNRLLSRAGIDKVIPGIKSML